MHVRRGDSFGGSGGASVVSGGTGVPRAGHSKATAEEGASGAEGSGARFSEGSHEGVVVGAPASRALQSAAGAALAMGLVQSAAVQVGLPRILPSRVPSALAPTAMPGSTRRVRRLYSLSVNDSL